MLSFPPAVRIWLALAPADLRKGFDALAELVRQHLRDDPLSGPSSCLCVVTADSSSLSQKGGHSGICVLGHPAYP
jgi:IS66 Orf2 like protein